MTLFHSHPFARGARLIMAPPPDDKQHKKRKFLSLFSPSSSPSSPSSSSKGELSPEGKVLFDTIVSGVNKVLAEISDLKELYTELSTKVENSTLSDQVASITSKLDQLTATTTSYAEITKKSIQSPKSDSNQQVLIARQAIRDENSVEQRKMQVFLKGLPEAPSDSTDSAELAKLSSTLGSDIVPPISSFRVGPSRAAANPIPRPIVLTFNSQREVSSFMRTLVSNRQSLPQLSLLSARPHYCPSDLMLYKDLWAQAIQRNNAAKKKLYTVLNLKLVNIPESLQTPWEVRTPVQVNQ